MAGDIEIRLAPQHVMTSEIWDPSFKLVKSLPWPFVYYGYNRECMVKQFVCSLKIDRTKELANQSLCMHVTVKEHGGPWKGGWVWEAFSCEFSSPAAVPQLDRKQVIKPKNEPQQVEA
jgi:hypothetical protein